MFVFAGLLNECAKMGETPCFKALVLCKVDSARSMLVVTAAATVELHCAALLKLHHTHRSPTIIVPQVTFLSLYFIFLIK